MDYSNIPLGLKITTQIPLDAKTIVNSEAVLSNLGFNNNLAFTYYDGMVVTCQLEKTDWQWREVVGSEVGLLATNFTYPNNIVVNGITYSLKNYNFFKKLQNVSEKQDNILANYKVLPSNFNFTSIPTGYENATWIIRHNFNLNDASITLPENVTLSFEGGSITNGSIVLNNTTIDYKNIKSVLNDVVLTGTLTNDSLDVRLFGILPNNNSIDATTIINNNLIALDVELLFPKGNYYFTELHITKHNFKIKGVTGTEIATRTTFNPFNLTQYYIIKLGGGKFTLNDTSAHIQYPIIQDIHFTTPLGYTALNLTSISDITGIIYRNAALVIDKVQVGKFAINGNTLHNTPLVSIGASYEMNFDYINMYGNHGKSDLPIIQFANNAPAGEFVSATIIDKIQVEVFVGPIIKTSNQVGINELTIGDFTIEGTIEWENESIFNETRYTHLTKTLPNYYSTVNRVPLFDLNGTISLVISTMHINATSTEWSNSLDPFPSSLITRTFGKFNLISSEIQINNILDGAFASDFYLEGTASAAYRNNLTIEQTNPDMAFYNSVTDNFNLTTKTHNRSAIKIKNGFEYLSNDLTNLLYPKFLAGIGLNNSLVTNDELKYNKTIGTIWDNYIINESGFYIEDDFIKIVGKIATTNNVIDIEYYNASNTLITTQNYSAAVTPNVLFENTILLIKPSGYSYLKLKSKNTGWLLKTYSLTTTSLLKDYINSNESLSLAKRKGDVLYGILDQYTGEEITLSKVTGTPTVDGIMFFQLGAEYFKRSARTVTPQMFGAKADSATNDTTALQNAINFCQTNNEILEITGNFACNTITISNNLKIETDCSLQILTNVDGLIITGRDTGYTQANVTTVKHIGNLTIRGFTANSFSKGITLKNGCLYSNFDKVFISNFGLGVYYKNTGNNNIINWNLLDVRDCSASDLVPFTKGAFVSPNDIFNIGEITTSVPIFTNMGTVLILQATEGSTYRSYPIVAKPSTTNTYYIGNFDQLPSSGTLVYYTGGGVYHEKHQDNGAVEYKTLRLGGIAGASLTVQSFYGVTVNGGQIEGCYTNVIVGGIFMNGINPETIYTIRCLFQGLHTEVNDANNPLIYSLKKSMIVFEGCIIPQPFVGGPETGVKFYDSSGSDRNSNIYYGKPTTTFPIIEPIDPTFKVYNDVENHASLLTLDLRDLLSGMTYVGDSRIKHIAVGEYNLLNIPVGETRTLRVRPFGWNTLNGGTANEDIVITGIANIKEYKIVFLLSDKDFTYYTTFFQKDLTSYTVATLPTGVLGDTAYVTDATTPTYLGALTGGGTVKCPVFYNGTAWISH